MPINLGTYPVCLDANNNPISSNIIYTGYSENDFDFAWTFAGNPLADTTSFLTVVLAGNYQAVATDKVTGCTQVFNATVTQVTGASATAVVATDFSGNQSITVKVTGGSGNFVYQINNSGFQPSNVFYVTKGGYYVIDIEDLNGCNVLQIMADVIDFPRFFTPNGDSYNDTWNVYGLPFPEKSQLFIFDRFGKLLKQVGLTGFGWDGNFNGQPLPADDYWFRLNYLDVNGMSREFKSHFTLKR